MARLSNCRCRQVGGAANDRRGRRTPTLLAVGEDNVLWGTDSIWYGSPQPLIDAFRAFQIPEAYRERYGYPELTHRLKAKILGLNAARVYGVDPERARAAARGDDLSWVRAALADYRERGTPRV